MDCPTIVNADEVSTTVNPVTQTALAEVNKAFVVDKSLINNIIISNET